MTFEIPLLDGVPMDLTTAQTPVAMASLARAITRAGLVEPEDLRVGTGGVRRFIEKPFERWWLARGLEEKRPMLPLRFQMIASCDWDEAPRGHKGIWLVMEQSRQWTRCYLERFIKGIGGDYPAMGEHVLSVLYAGADSLCYALKPPDMLRLARAYWWGGTDDEKLARANGNREVMSRRVFNNRVPLMTQAPRYNRRAFLATPPFKQLKASTDLLDRWWRDPRILRPNAHKLSGCPPGHLSLALRTRYGDPSFRLLHDHWHNAENRKTCDYVGAWKVPHGREGLHRMLVRVEATARLARAVEDLLVHVTWYSRGGFH